MMVSLNYKIEDVKGSRVFGHSNVYDRLISGINLGIFITLLYAAIQWMFLSQRVNGNITGLMTDSNALGSSLIITWPLSVALMIGGPNIFQRVIAGISVILGVLIIFPLGSRIAQGALITNMLIFTSIWIWHERPYIRDHVKIVRVIIATLVLIFSGFIIFTLSFTSENIITTWLLPILEIKKGSGLYPFLNLFFRPDRFPLIVQAINMTKDYPLSGIGLGTFYFELSNFYRIYVTDLSSILAYLDMAHNYYLQISSELGLIGLSFILWMIVLIIKTIWKGIKIPFINGDRWLFYGISSGLVSMFIFFIFEALLMFPDISLIYWFSVGILYKIATNQKKGDSLFPNRALLGWGIVLVIFAISLTYSSTHSLSVPNRQRLIGWEYTYGYYHEETWSEGKVRWTERKSLREIEVKSPVLSINLFCGHPDVQKMPVQANLWIDNSHVGGVTFFKNGWKDVNIHLPFEKGKKVRLKIEVDRTFTPYKWKINNDRRDLGLAVLTEVRWLDKIPENETGF
jgi:O-antigen ligase